MCLFVRLFSIEIQMAGQIGTKFGSEVVLGGWGGGGGVGVKVLRGVSARGWGA